MRVLVTGGSGFLGGAVVPRLRDAGHEVVAMARSASAAARVAAVGAQPVAGDLDDPASVDAAFCAAGADALVNLASLGFGHAPTVVAAAEEAGLKRAVFVSTTAIFTTLDARSKAVRQAAEDTVRSSSLRWTIVRPTMIYGGPGDRNVARLLRTLARCPVVPVPGGGRRLQQPVHVDDLAAAVVATLHAPLAEDRAYDVAGPEAIPFRQLLVEAGAAVGRAPRLVPVPLAPVVAAVGAYERLAPHPRLRAEQLERLAEDKAFDISPARADLGYAPRSFAEGVGQEAVLLGLAPPPAAATSSGALAQALLLARTARHLHPAQPAHRLRLRAQRRAASLAPGAATAWLRRHTATTARPAWPEDFVPLDARLASGCPSAEANAEGRFSFLEQERRLGDPADWDQAGAARLWRYHLHYFEWAWAFAAHPDRAWARDAFARLWRSWRGAVTLSHPDAWSPYVASLRGWAMCGLYHPLIAGSEHEADFVADLGVHARFTRAHLELDVGGNHLVKNLKALVGLGVFLGDDAVVAAALRHVERQVDRQVLADGGHFERSPSYHCQVLGDLLDVADLLAAAGRSAPANLIPALKAMRGWLGAMLMPDGEVPLFNDCTAVGADRLKLLEPAIPPAARLTVLQPSGYVVARVGDRLHLVADVGPPCPPELPAHAHADCLSFELAVDGRRVVVDTGTSTYEPGARRSFERSTAAHNTVEVDGADQTEVWGTFRAARRAKPTLEQAEEAGGDAVTAVASHDGYGRLPGRPQHRRRFHVTPETVEVTDELTGAGRHRAVARLHLAPDVTATPTGRSTVNAGPLTVTVSPNGAALGLETIDVATGFGRTEPATVVTATAEGQLPLRLVTTLALAARDGTR